MSIEPFQPIASHYEMPQPQAVAPQAAESSQDLAATAPGQLRVILAHGTPLVRPDDVLTALTKADPAFVLGDPPVLTRLAQGRLVDGAVRGPFEGDSGA